MINNERWALFDFCETLVNFQTADAYVRYVIEKSPTIHSIRWGKFLRLLRGLKLIQIAERLTFHRISLNKQLTLFLLKGKSYKELDKLAKEYYEECIKPNYIQNIYKIMKEKKVTGYNIAIVSGGYDIYLKYFVEEHHLQALVSTRIGFKGNVCTGRFAGIDCLRSGKVVLLDAFWGSKRPKAYVEAYTDSKTDLPFLKWADVGYVISKNHSQNWAKNNQLKEIIWQEEKR